MLRNKQLTHFNSHIQSFEVARAVTFGVVLSVLIVLANFGLQQLYSTLTSNTPARSALASSATKPPQNSRQVLPAPAPSAQTQPDKPSSQELQAVLDKWQQDYKDADFGVVVQESASGGRSASLQPDVVFEGASLYKLYLADYVYSKVAQGSFSLSDTFGTSWTLGSCLKIMIEVSDNACAEAVGSAVGWKNFHNYVRSSGFSNTVMSPYNQTTAADMAKYLKKLYEGSLIDPAYANDLLSYMRKQMYRSAIPAGVSGVAVANKVGFKENIWHDAAIVYHPKGDYVLVVLSQGSGTAPIKDLSSRISDFMNR